LKECGRNIWPVVEGENGAVAPDGNDDPLSK